MKIGFIGSGKMASALLEGILRADIAAADEVFITDKIAAAATELAQRTGVRACRDNAAIARETEVLILCVKPGDVPPALKEAGDLSGKLLISIAAGIPLRRLKEWAQGAPRLIRVMPNTPALIGLGAAAYAGAEGTGEEDLAIADRIFGAVGIAVRTKEALLDSVTGLSGSGPAFVYTVIEALADGGVLMGLPRDIALRLAAQTVQGAAAMVLQTGLHPAQLRDQVTSPGGTTIAGLEALEEAGLRSALIGAVRAATERSGELGAVG
ncbi:MAG TPA: pyrroline-5-carboxylate reductase [Chthoniobacteraceae bacterium]|jgi:pyrroline-5-carboxylate reductase|nr:pyrroline-5-carboxylate reductase [Chthoniobacteraceae bacterium]